MTHEHARRDGKPVDDPDLCFLCARAELRSMRVDLAPLPGVKDNQRSDASTPADAYRPDGCPVHQLLTA